MTSTKERPVCSLTSTRTKTSQAYKFLQLSAPARARNVNPPVEEVNSAISAGDVEHLPCAPQATTVSSI